MGLFDDKSAKNTLQIWPDGQLFRVELKTLCAGVIVADEIIIWTAPILSRFKWQPILNLIRWSQKMGGDCLEVQVPKI